MPRLLEALTPDEKAAYLANLKDVLERADGRDADMLAAVKVMVLEARDALAARWLQIVDDGTEWDVFITRQMDRILVEVAHDLAAKYEVAVDDILPDAYLIGAEMVDTAIGGAGFSVSALPAIAPETVQLAAVIRPELITNVSDAMVGAVQKEVQKAFILGDSPFSVMQGIARTGIDAGPWKSTAVRAEVIARTEIATIQGVAAQSRMEAVVRQYPGMGMKKVWLVAHILEWPCQICAPLEGTVWDVNDPNAPTVPRHPRCACALVPYFPGLSTEVKNLSKDTSLHDESRETKATEEP